MSQKNDKNDFKIEYISLALPIGIALGIIYDNLALGISFGLLGGLIAAILFD